MFLSCRWNAAAAAAAVNSTRVRRHLHTPIRGDLQLLRRHVGGTAHVWVCVRSSLPRLKCRSLPRVQTPLRRPSNSRPIPLEYVAPTLEFSTQNDLELKNISSNSHLTREKWFFSLFWSAFLEKLDFQTNASIRFENRYENVKCTIDTFCETEIVPVVVVYND